METQVRSKNGDGGSPVTNLGALLSGVNVVPVMPPGEGGGQEVLAESGSTPAAGNGNNGNGTAAPENGVGMSDETSEAAAVAETATVVTPDTKFVFRTWLMAGIFMILKRFLRHVDLGALFREGNGPDRQRDSERIQSGWKKLVKLQTAIGDHEKWRTMLLAIIAGIEEKTGKGCEFTFVDAAKNTKVVKEVGFGLAWALNADDRAELTSAILVLEENSIWFGLKEVVEADYQAFLAKNRQREEARQRRAAEREAEEKRIEEFADLGDLLTVAKDVGVELTTIVSREAIAATQTRLPEVGEVIDGKLDQLMVGENDEGQTFVSGFRFERLPGRREMPFLPARFIPDRWRRFEDETTLDYEQRLKASMANGVLLSVEKVEKDERGLRVLVQIRTPEELVAMKSCGRHNPFARPPRKLEEGESVTGRVAGRSQYGVRVAFRGGIQLFAHVSNIAEGLSLAVGNTVYGVVIPGHDGREFDLAIRERVVEEDEGEEAPEYIIHAGRVEEIRQYVLERGISLTDERQEFLRSCDERARKLSILTDEEVEVVHAFFEDILKDADRRFESVVVTLRDYRREQEDAAEEPQGEADSRPFCANHATEDGEPRCNRRVAEEGKQCLRCGKSGTPRRPVPGAKKRGLKGRKPKN